MHLDKLVNVAECRDDLPVPGTPVGAHGRAPLRELIPLMSNAGWGDRGSSVLTAHPKEQR
jgi:hypothetical protein